MVITDFSICLTTKIAILSLLQTNDKIKHSRETAQLVTSASEHGRMENANPKEDAVWNSDRICRLQVQQAPRQSQEGKWTRMAAGEVWAGLSASLVSGGGSAERRARCPRSAHQRSASARPPSSGLVALGCWTLGRCSEALEVLVWISDCSLAWI